MQSKIHEYPQSAFQILRFPTASWPLNSMGLNCTGPLIYGVFSTDSQRSNPCCSRVNSAAGNLRTCIGDGSCTPSLKCTGGRRPSPMLSKGPLDMLSVSFLWRTTTNCDSPYHRHLSDLRFAEIQGWKPGLSSSISGAGEHGWKLAEA